VAGPSHSLTTLDFWPPFVNLLTARNLFDEPSTATPPLPQQACS